MLSSSKAKSSQPLCEHCAQQDWDYHIRRHADKRSEEEFYRLPRTHPPFQIPQSPWDPCLPYRFEVGNYLVSEAKWDGDQFHYLNKGITSRFFAPSLKAILDPLRDCTFCRLVATLLIVRHDAESLKRLLASEHTVLCHSLKGLSSRILKVDVLSGAVTSTDIRDCQYHDSLAQVLLEVVDNRLHTPVHTSFTPVRRRLLLDTKLFDRHILTRWYNDCQAHPRCRKLNTALRTCFDIPGFKVIDVVTRRVVVAPPQCKYLALSYVWGDKVPYRARKEDFVEEENRKCSNSKHLSDYLELDPSRVPQTVEDAMVVVGLLGERYLW
jgi:hypothetical protein